MLKDLVATKDAAVQNSESKESNQSLWYPEDIPVCNQSSFRPEDNKSAPSQKISSPAVKVEKTEVVLTKSPNKLSQPTDLPSYEVVSKDEPMVLESVHTILTQPGTPVSFRGMCIVCYSISGNSGNFRCFPFPENSGTPTFPFSGNSGLRRFLLLVIRSCISPFTCDSVVSPCFMLLFSLMYSGLSLYPVHPYSTP